jgi:hypothetical protein
VNSDISAIREVLSLSAPVSLVTSGEGGAHLIGVWNDDILISDENTLLVPVAGMKRTERNIKEGSPVGMLIAHRDIGDEGAGFRIRGDADIHYFGERYDTVKEKFIWARAALVISITSIEKIA